MEALDLISLTELMAHSSGRPDVKIGLIDGPVLIQHPDLASERLQEVSGTSRLTCAQAGSAACLHGTFIAGILCARRGYPAPAVSPHCTLLIRPIFAEMTADRDGMPSAVPHELAAAIVECIDAGARVLNLSLAVARPSIKEQAVLEDALDFATKRGVIVVAAAGNQGAVGSSPITRHPWTIPVVACDRRGRPTRESNLGGSIGRRGLSAPGEQITSLGAEGAPLTLSGTSVAAPFVTGAIALLWSEFPQASAASIKLAVTQASRPRRNTIVPPLLNAALAYQALSNGQQQKRTA
jgi:subtilisin family serine protease